MTPSSLPVRTHFPRLTATCLSVAIPRFAAFKLPAEKIEPELGQANLPVPRGSGHSLMRR